VKRLSLLLLTLLLPNLLNAFSWQDTEVGYFPTGFSCMTNEEKVNFKYYLSHAYSGIPYDKRRAEIEGSQADMNQRFFNKKLDAEEWLCPSQALAIRNQYELDREKARRGKERRQDVVHSVRFQHRTITGKLFGEWGIEINGGLYGDRKGNLDYKDGKLVGKSLSTPITVRPLNISGVGHRFIIVSVSEDQHVVCYPKSMHKECNPFKPAPPEQLVNEPLFKYQFDDSSSEKEIKK
jgi:hypothetical protein